MKLVPVDSLSDGKQLTYGDLKPDDWFSSTDYALPTSYKTDCGYASTEGRQYAGSHGCFQPTTPVRVYNCELHYERVE